MQIMAAVAEERSAPFTIRTLELDEPQVGEVIVRVAGARICHIDLSVRDANSPPILPAVLGHERAGVVGGIDYSLEATGAPSVLRQAVLALTNRGVCGLIDLFIPRLIKLHQEGRLPFDRLIRYYPLHDINAAVDDARRGATIKPVLRMAG